SFVEKARIKIAKELYGALRGFADVYRGHAINSIYMQLRDFDGRYAVTVYAAEPISAADTEIMTDCPLHVGQLLALNLDMILNYTEALIPGSVLEQEWEQYYKDEEIEWYVPLTKIKNS